MREPLLRTRILIALACASGSACRDNSDAPDDAGMTPLFDAGIDTACSALSEDRERFENAYQNALTNGVLPDLARLALTTDALSNDPRIGGLIRNDPSF